MLKGAVGRRYARAIFDIAVEQNTHDRWMADLQNMEQVLSDPRVAQIMGNPEIPLDVKKKIAESAVSVGDALGTNLLHLLVTRGRTDIVGEVRAEFEALLNDYRGVAYADVTTAVPLNDAEAGLIADKLTKLTGKSVRLRQSVDPAIIGGVVARIGDRLVDGSVRGRLVALRERLIKTGV